MKRLLASCFGLGRLPIAPGTWGSVPPVAVLVLLSSVGAPGALTTICMVIMAAAGSVVCVAFAPAVMAATGKADPGEVVADEFAGQAVTFLAVPMLTPAALSVGRLWITGLVGFVLFRAFDIAKPWPIHRLERLPKGWGVLADDLLAGVYAAICLQVCVRLWIVG